MILWETEWVVQGITKKRARKSAGASMNKLHELKPQFVKGRDAARRFSSGKFWHRVSHHPLTSWSPIFFVQLLQTLINPRKRIIRSFKWRESLRKSWTVKKEQVFLWTWQPDEKKALTWMINKSETSGWKEKANSLSLRACSLSLSLFSRC